MNINWQENEARYHQFFFSFFKFIVSTTLKTRVKQWACGTSAHWDGIAPMFISKINDAPNRLRTILGSVL